MDTTIRCACGCGTVVSSLDAKGRPRRFVPGHQARIPSAAQLAQRAKFGREIRHHGTPWNKGRSYLIAKRTAYANKGTWAKALFRCFPNRCMRCGWDGACCDTHHIVPKRDGGQSTLANGVILCPNCHRLAHAGKISADELLAIRDAVPNTVEAR